MIVGEVIIIVSSEQLTLLKRARNWLCWVCLAILVLFRASGYPFSIAAGVCLLLGIAGSAAMLAFLLIQQKRRSVDRLRSSAIRNDLHVRILLVGVATLALLPFEVVPQAGPYFVTIAAFVAVAYRALEFVTEIERKVLEWLTDIQVLEDLLLALILFVFGYQLVSGFQRPQSESLSLITWPVFYLSALRTYQFSSALFRSKSQCDVSSHDRRRE